MSLSGSGCAKCNGKGCVPFSDDALRSMLRPCGACSEPWGPRWLDFPSLDGFYWLRIGDGEPEPVRVRTARENARDPREECLYVDRLGCAITTHTSDLARRNDARLQWLPLLPPDVPR